LWGGLKGLHGQIIQGYPPLGKCLVEGLCAEIDAAAVCE
jgi:hypothetical protein